MSAPVSKIPSMDLDSPPTVSLQISMGFPFPMAFAVFTMCTSVVSGASGRGTTCTTVCPLGRKGI